MNYKLNFVTQDLYLNIHGIELLSITETSMVVDIHKTQKNLLNKNILQLNSLNYFEVNEILNTKDCGTLSFNPAQITQQYFIAVRCEFNIPDIDLTKIIVEQGVYCITGEFEQYTFLLATILYSLSLHKLDFNLYTLFGIKYKVDPKTISYLELIEHAEIYCAPQFNELNCILALSKFGYLIQDDLVYLPLHRLLNDLDDVFGDYIGYVNWNSFDCSEDLYAIEAINKDNVFKAIDYIKSLNYKFIKLNYLTSYSMYSTFSQLKLPIIKPINPTSTKRDLFNDENKILEILQNSQRLQSNSLPLKVYSLYENETAYELITLTLLKQQNPSNIIKSLIKLDKHTCELEHNLFQIYLQNQNTYCGIISQETQDFFKYRPESTIIISIEQILKT